MVYKANEYYWYFSANILLERTFLLTECAIEYRTTRLPRPANIAVLSHKCFAVERK